MVAHIKSSNVVPDSMSGLARRPACCSRRAHALDVHIISPLQQNTIQEAAFTPGHALLVGKLTAHLQACRSVGVTFIPMVAERSRGRLHQHHPCHQPESKFPVISVQTALPPTGDISLERQRVLHREHALPPSVDGII